MLALRKEMTCTMPLVFQQGNTREGRERSERGRDRMRETKDGERERDTKVERERYREEEDTYREPKRRTVYKGKKSERRQEVSAGEGCLAHA